MMLLTLATLLVAVSTSDAAPALPGVPAPRRIELPAADGARVFADLYVARAPAGAGVVGPVAAPAARSPLGSDAPIVLLFHQAGSNAAEYASIAPELASHGYHCLAVDQRAGGRLWGRNNRTVAARGVPADFDSAYADLEGALAWVDAHGYRGKVIAWGSSYSATLVLRLAAEHGRVDAVLAFSPGDYLGNEQLLYRWAAAVAVPAFVTSGPGTEAIAARTIARALASEAKVHYVAREGAHGSATLRLDRNPGGAAENWRAVLAFLEQHAR